MKTRLSKIRVAASIVALTVLAAGPAFTQQVRPVLTETDIAKFIQDFKAMSAEFDAIEGLEDADDTDGDEMPDLGKIANAMRNSAEVLRILRKYGWNESFVTKYVAIMGGYIILTFQDVGAGMDSQIAAQMAAIDNNPGLSAEQKAQMKSVVSGFAGQMSAAMQMYRAQVHPADVRLVEANKEALTEVFEDDE